MAGGTQGGGTATTDHRTQRLQARVFNFCSNKERRSRVDANVRDGTPKEGFCCQGCLFCFRDGRSQSGECRPIPSEATMERKSLFLQFGGHHPHVAIKHFREI